MESCLRYKSEFLQSTAGWTDEKRYDKFLLSDIRDTLEPTLPIVNRIENGFIEGIHIVQLDEAIDIANPPLGAEEIETLEEEEKAKAFSTRLRPENKRKNRILMFRFFDAHQVFKSFEFKDIKKLNFMPSPGTKFLIHNSPKIFAGVVHLSEHNITFLGGPAPPPTAPNVPNSQQVSHPLPLTSAPGHTNGPLGSEGRGITQGRPNENYTTNANNANNGNYNSNYNARNFSNGSHPNTTSFANNSSDAISAGYSNNMGNANNGANYSANNAISGGYGANNATVGGYNANNLSNGGYNANNASNPDGGSYIGYNTCNASYNATSTNSASYYGNNANGVANANRGPNNANSGASNANVSVYNASDMNNQGAIREASENARRGAPMVPREEDLLDLDLDDDLLSSLSLPPRQQVPQGRERDQAMVISPPSSAPHEDRDAMRGRSEERGEVSVRQYGEMRGMERGEGRSGIDRRDEETLIKISIQIFDVEPILCSPEELRERRRDTNMMDEFDVSLETANRPIHQIKQFIVRSLCLAIPPHQKHILERHQIFVGTVFDAFITSKSFAKSMWWFTCPSNLPFGSLRNASKIFSGEAIVSYHPDLSVLPFPFHIESFLEQSP